MVNKIKKAKQCLDLLNYDNESTVQSYISAMTELLEAYDECEQRVEEYYEMLTVDEVMFMDGFMSGIDAYKTRCLQLQCSYKHS